MPSLMPGTPGAKEAYGISVIRDDLHIAVPPKALQRYKLQNDSPVVLISTRPREGGFAILNKDSARDTVFQKYIAQITEPDKCFRFNKKDYILTALHQGKLHLTPEMLAVFNLAQGARLMVVKSTTVAMSFSPVEVWRAKFAQHGLFEAIGNMENLEEF